MGHEDADLIRSWRHGDAAAFEALVRRWQQPVARFLARVVGRRELVQDLCQEVFLRVYLAAPRYREQGSFSTWLYRIALNVARDAGRRRRREPAPLPAAGPADADAGPPSEALCERQELAVAVAEAVAGLPRALREVLVLRHYEEMSFEEIGRLLKVPASTLKSRFAVALGRLRVRLRRLGWGDEETP
jgi:RNA polymerase sigma-70 factor (ECF subfamily)